MRLLLLSASALAMVGCGQLPPPTTEQCDAARAGFVAADTAASIPLLPPKQQVAADAALIVAHALFVQVCPPEIVQTTPTAREIPAATVIVAPNRS